MRTLTSLADGKKLWDVDNVEAHVHATLDHSLDQKRARLNAQQYQRAFAFMWSLCWELSGLDTDGLSLRWVWEVHGFYAPRGRRDDFVPVKLQQFPRRESAELALEALQRRAQLVFTAIAKVRPRGAYDPSHGLAFVTYSRRVMMKRLPDWYRSDPEFGDNRYAGNRLTNEISYEGLAAQRRDDLSEDGGDYLERRGPGSRLDFVDELNPHAYQESIEEVLMRETASR